MAPHAFSQESAWPSAFDGHIFSKVKEPPAIANPASDMTVLNSRNHELGVPSTSDIAVVGAGLLSLIYAIQVRKSEQLHGQAMASIVVLDKETSPSYKIGESTLAPFGLWLKTIGVASPLLWRIFGTKDGLAFYYLNQEGDEKYTTFCANGPPGHVVTTLQMERKMTELLLTLVAQRSGITVLHGHPVDFNDATISGKGSTLKIRNVESGNTTDIRTSLIVDATGRFRQLTSKAGRVKRFDGFNTNAYWAYFEQQGDEDEIPLREWETCNTNHMCMPEGWAWVIKLCSWEGSPIANLVRMLEHLLDLSDRNTPADEYPSVKQLVSMFDLKFRWVVSIGFALRTDVEYPEDLPGSCEAERKFDWMVSRYPKMQALMQKHTLIPDLYGPGTTWFVRKNLTYQSPQVAGDGWFAIGDATGFTNPLYSPGINANLATSVRAAEITPRYLAGDTQVKEQLAEEYGTWCKSRIPNLNRMNTFNYLCMRSPATGPIGPLWNYFFGMGQPKWAKIKTYTLADATEFLTDWEWGTHKPEYIEFTSNIIGLLDGPPTAPDEETLSKVRKLSEQSVREVRSKGIYKNRWAGLLRYYNDYLESHPEKTFKDVLADRCKECRNWKLLCEGMLKCPWCGYACSIEESKPMLADSTAY